MILTVFQKRKTAHAQGWTEQLKKELLANAMELAAVPQEGIRLMGSRQCAVEWLEPCPKPLR